MLDDNRRVWDERADAFAGEKGALPLWGRFGIGTSFPDLIGPVEGRTFVEIGCGSGHSIRYLITRGAQHVTGIDFSATQIALARETNTEAIAAGRVTLIQAAMEQPQDVRAVDTVFSVFALGWTVDPDRTFANVYRYLKPGGRFVWSWQHPFWECAAFDGQQITVPYSYFDEGRNVLDGYPEWGSAQIPMRSVSTWFRHLRGAGFDVVDLLEPEPEDFERLPALSDYPTSRSAKAARVPYLMIVVCEKPAS
jgi:SAM-dependent methyltransferase